MNSEEYRTSHSAERRLRVADDAAREAHERGLWVYPACAALGLWLLTGPVTMGYADAPAGWSEMAAGLVVSVFGVLAIRFHRTWSPWAICAVGLWLLFAPLLLWTPIEAAYLNSTISGIALIGLAVVVNRRFWAQGVVPATPAGWSFNPSSWVQRTPIIALAWLCFVISRYLTGYQLGYSEQAWDPFFGDGTQRVLDSDVAEAWPISDAGLGAVAYALEALTGCMGGASRWRTAPWVVALFGLLVVPAGIVSIVLIILQPVAVGAWCTLCLVAAVAMLVMACLALPEVVAMVDYLMRCRRAGHSVKQVFWRGGPEIEALPRGSVASATVMNGGGEESQKTQESQESQESREHDGLSLSGPPRAVWRTMVEGTTLPWNLVVSLVLGLWIMLSPPILTIADPAANSHFLTGWLIITVTVLALSEVARIVRLVNIALGGWIIATPWLLAGVSDAAQWNAVAAGALLIVLSIPRGRIHGRYGRWRRWII